MNVNYSIIKIIKYKTGYKIIIILIILLILNSLTLIIIENNTLLLLMLFLPFPILILISLIYLVYLLYNIIKIKCFFKNGIENYGIVIDNNYHVESKYLIHSQYLFYKILSPWNIKETSSGEYINLDRKTGVIIKYIIDNEERENAYNFRINNETMYIKEGSRVKILINPKNKNELIIKEIYEK